MKTKINYTLIQDGTEAIKTVYQGILTKLDENSYRLTYTNENKDLVTLNFDTLNNTLMVTNSNSVMFFEKDTKSDVDYKTDFGVINLKLDVHNVEILNEYKCIKINALYDLVQGSETLKNDLSIMVEIK